MTAAATLVPTVAPEVVLSAADHALLDLLWRHAIAGSALAPQSVMAAALTCSAGALSGRLHRLGRKGVISRAQDGWCLPGGLVARVESHRPAEPARSRSQAGRRHHAGRALAALAADACRFPIGDPRDPGFRFCGAAVMADGAVYCAEHHRLTHRQPPDKAEG